MLRLSLPERHVVATVATLLVTFVASPAAAQRNGNGDQVGRFAASLVQHGEDWEPALTGSVSFRASGSPLPPLPDSDGDGTVDSLDNCPFASNSDQANDDGDEFGAVCDSDGYTVETIEMTSEPGDWVGAGKTYKLGPADGQLWMTSATEVRASFEFRGEHVWNFSFVSPEDWYLEVGAFENAQRFPFQQPNRPGLEISGEARGCKDLTGRFDVLEAKYGYGPELISFAVDFEQHCEGGDPALFGKIRYHTKPPCECADPDASAGGPIASDCRTVLLKAVGVAVACPAECCNIDSKGTVSAGDALHCLQCAVGVRDCTCEPE